MWDQALQQKHRLLGSSKPGAENLRQLQLCPRDCFRGRKQHRRKRTAPNAASEDDSGDPVSNTKYLTNILRWVGLPY